MLTTADLARMRATQLAFLSQSCSIQRDSAASDGMGGFDLMSGSAGAGSNAVACRVGTTAWRAEEQELAGRIGVAIPYYVTLPYGTDVKESDRIVCGTRTFEVKMVLKPSLETARRCICKEIV